MEEKISSNEGFLLKVDRSIQSEDIFVFQRRYVFRRFLTWGNAKNTAKLCLLSMAIKILKLYINPQKMIENGP